MITAWKACLLLVILAAFAALIACAPLKITDDTVKYVTDVLTRLPDPRANSTSPVVLPSDIRSLILDVLRENGILPNP